MNTKIKAYYTIVGDMLSLAPQCKEIANAVGTRDFIKRCS